MPDKQVEILDRQERLRVGFFRWYAVKFRYRKFNGDFSKSAEYMVLDRGDSVAMLVHDVPKDEVVLVEQFRISAYGPTSGWIYELPAGRVEDGEDPQSTAIREVIEETGASAKTPEWISSFFLSPGGTTERIHLYYFGYTNGLKVGEHGGLAAEGEDIRVHRMPLPKALEMVKHGEIADAKTILALFWLRDRTNRIH